MSYQTQIPMALRFPNPGSNFERMVSTYGLLYKEFGEEVKYDLDDATEVLVDHFQVSSSGAVGEEAISRSFQEDRSRDSLYNQLKMYSELFRLLGWVHPSENKKLVFRNTLLGEWIAKENDKEKISNLLQECILGITFPNPNSENKGIERLRFFPHLLSFMEELGGIAHRDEIIVGLYTISDDSEPDLIEKKANEIKEIRGSKSDRNSALKKVAKRNGVQPNTLQNYTRFTIGVLKSELIDWAEPNWISDVYENSTKFYDLTENGRQQAMRFREGVDVRIEHTTQLSLKARAYLVCIGYASMLLRSGYETFEDDIMILNKMIDDYPKVKKFIGNKSLKKVYFYPYQQVEHEIIKRGEMLYQKKIA